MTRTPTNLVRLALAALLAGWFAPAFAAAAPAPETLLDWALAPPVISYRGRMMFTQWFGKQARAEDIDVYWSAGRSRREFLAPDGSKTRVIISDGERQEVHLVKKGRVLQGDAVKSYEKVMPPDSERKLLLKNYRLTASGPETIAGRPCWVLRIDPILAGKPAQKLWLDQQTHVVLENKRYIPKRSFAAMIRYTRFVPDEQLPDELFRLEASTAPATPGKGLEPDFLTLEQLNAATGKDAKLPAELPSGFQFESADFFMIGKQTVRHARYTDGLSVLSLFLTDKPVRVPKGERLHASGLPGASLRLSSAGKVLRWRRGRLHLTLLGDVTRELLQQLASSLK